MEIAKTINYLCAIECLYGYFTIKCCNKKICELSCKKTENEIISIDQEWDIILQENKQNCIFENIENDSSDSEIEMPLNI